MDGISFDRQENFSDLIGLIYDSAQNPELWPKLLQKIDLLINATEEQSSDPLTVSAKDSELAILRPHFQRALQLNRKLYDLKNERDAVSSVLDRLPIGVILVDEELIPAAINRHAEKILRLGTSICLHDGKLSGNSVTDTEKIRYGIAQAAATKDATSKGWSLILGTESTSPCSIHIMPSAHAGVDTEMQLMAVFIACAGISHSISAETLVETYRLTRAEGRLLRTLLNGSHSLPEAASKLGVSKHTARSQFKSILEKTGTHSQTELLKRVLTGPVALIGEKQETLPIANLAALESSISDTRDEDNAFKTIKLMDGRVLEYREYGDPRGTPVLFFHGCIHSRRTIHPHSKYAETNGIRLIVPERPGFGASTLLPRQHEPDLYAGDIRQLLEHLGIDKVRVFSDASGAQSAFLCACYLAQKIEKAAIVTVYPEPRFDFPEKALKAERIMLRTYQKLPAVFHSHIARIITRNLSRNPDNYFNSVMDQMPESDRAIITTPEHRAIVAESFENAYPNNIRGFTDDFMQRVKPWPFDIGQCKIETVIWHGSANSIVPIETAKKIATTLSNATLRTVEGGGHYIIISHWDEILAELVKP